MLGFLIRDYLLENGLDANHISEEAGIDRERFQNLLNENQKIEATEYFHICRVLGIRLDYFYSRQNMKDIKE